NRKKFCMVFVSRRFKLISRLFHHSNCRLRECVELDDPYTIHYVKWDERRPGILRGCPSVGDERYVLKNEFEQTKGHIHKRINEVDIKHDEKHNHLNLVLHTFIEQHEPLGKALRSIVVEANKLNDTMGPYDKR